MCKMRKFQTNSKPDQTTGLILLFLVKNSPVFRAKHALYARTQHRIGFQLRIRPQDGFRLLARILHQLHITRQVGHFQAGQAVLALAKKIARAALNQVGTRNFKPVVCIYKDF